MMRHFVQLSKLVRSRNVKITCTFKEELKEWQIHDSNREDWSLPHKFLYKTYLPMSRIVWLKKLDLREKFIPSRALTKAASNTMGVRE